MVEQVLSRTCQRVCAKQRKAAAVQLRLQQDAEARSSAPQYPQEPPPSPPRNRPPDPSLSHDHSFSEEIAESPGGDPFAGEDANLPDKSPVRNLFSGRSRSCSPVRPFTCSPVQGQEPAPAPSWAAAGLQAAGAYAAAGLQAAFAGGAGPTKSSVNGKNKKKKVSNECGVRFKTFTLLVADVYRFHCIPG